MKRTAIQILTIVLLFSCSKEEEIRTVDGIQGILKISANMPELEVFSKASVGSEQAIFAYVATDLENSQLNPLDATIQQGDTYHYEIPDGTQKVLFSNIGAAESEQINLSTTSEGLLKLSIKDSVYMGTNQDVMFAYLDNIETGNDQAYQVNFKRMATKLKVRLNLIIDNDTIRQTADLLEGGEVSINGFSQHLLINNGGVAEFSGVASLKFPLTADVNRGLSADDIYIFPANGSSHELLLKIKQASGQDQILKATVNQALEANKYYTLTLNLKKGNIGVGFSLADVVVEQTLITDYNKDESSFLSLSSNNVFLQKELGNIRGIEILTRLNNWSAEIQEGSEWLSIDTLQGVNGDTLYFSSLSENADAFRFGKVLITADQFQQEILIQQSNGGLQTIVLYPKDNCDVYVSGENFTVDYNDGNGAQGPYTVSSQNFIKNDCDSVIIQGENITFLQQGYYNETSSYYDSYDINRIFLKDCYSLATLQISGLQDSIVNFSQAPNLKKLSCVGGNLKEMVFAEGTPLGSLNISNSPMTTLDLTSIHTTLKELSCSNSDNLTIIEIYPAEFSGDRVLEKLNISECDAFSGLNLTNFSNLKELNTNSCSKLEAIVARNCISLPQLSIYYNPLLATININGCTALTKLDFDNLYALNNLRTEGCSNLSDVSLFQCNSLTTVDFMNYSLLKMIEISYCNSVNEVLLNGCSILEKALIDNTYPQKMDFTSCSRLTELELRCDNTTDLSLDSCSALLNLSIYNPYKMTTFDPSVCSALEMFSWWGTTSYYGNVLTNVTTLDFSQNIQLKSIAISRDRKLNNLNLSNCNQLEDIELIACDSLRTLNLDGQNTLKRFVSTNDDNYYFPISTRLSSLDFSDYTALTYVQIEDTPELTEVNLSGCLKLEEYYGLNNPKVSSIQTANCGLLQIFKCSNNSQLGSLDFTGSSVLTNVDCSYCILDAEKLNAMFTSLPDLTTSINIGTVKIIGNPGADSCDKTIVDDAKNWLFSEE